MTTLAALRAGGHVFLDSFITKKERRASHRPILGEGVDSNRSFKVHCTPTLLRVLSKATTFNVKS